MADTSEIAGLDKLGRFASNRLVIIGFDLTADDPDLQRLIAALPGVRVVSFSDHHASAPGIETAPKSLPLALAAARRLDVDAVVLADDARKLAVLAFATRADAVFVSRSGCIIPRSRRSFLEERSPILETISAARRAKELTTLPPVTAERHQRFYVVSCSRHAGDAAIRCLESVASQDYPRDLIEHVYLDDQSTDDTPRQIQAWLGMNPRHRVRYIQTNVRGGGTKNTRDLFRAAPAGTVVVEINGDDWLPDPGVFSYLDRVYADPDVWMTYNSSVYPSGAPFPGNHPYAAATVAAGSFREDVWRAGLLRTFRAELFDHVPDDALIDPETGTWWQSADDQAIYLALLELSGYRSRHLARTTYIYNNRDLSEDHIDLRGGRRRAAAIRKQPRHRPLRTLSPRRPRHAPLVSVVMPLADSETFVTAALNSVLSQRYEHFELILVDDGSTDDSAKIAERFADADERITLLAEDRAGLAAAMNHGIDAAQGALIARADVREISHPDRLLRQVAFLEDRPDVVLVSEDPRGRSTSCGTVGWAMCFAPAVAPGAAMLRRRHVEQVGRYDTRNAVVGAEDFDLFVRLEAIGKVANLAGLNEPLTTRTEPRPDCEMPTIRVQAARAAQILGRPIGHATATDLHRLHRAEFDRPMNTPHLTFETLDALFRTYLSQRVLTESEREAVRFDAATKMLWLGAWCGRTAPSLAAKVLNVAQQIDRRAIVEVGTRHALQEIRDRVRQFVG